MGRPKLEERKIAVSVTLEKYNLVLFRLLGKGNASEGIAELVDKARTAGIIDDKLEKSIKATMKRNPAAEKEDDIFY